MSKKSSLLKVNIRSLTNEGLNFSGPVTAEELQIEADDRLSVLEPFEVKLHVATVHGGLLVQGSATGELRCRCDRCLVFFNESLEEVEICHLYEDLTEDSIDLTEDVREDILLAFPQWSVCRETCRGLCSNCGQNLNVRECSCRQMPDGESPWGRLDSLQLPDSGQE